MKVIGLTGGTGSGKSTVAEVLKDNGFLLIDADIIARNIVEKGSNCLEDIKKYFGDEILLENKSLNRKKLGTIVFADKKKLQILNEITHKYIIEEVNRIIANEREKGMYSTAVIDAAILIETGLNELCDIILIVYADEDTRIRRIINRDGLSYEDAFNRVKSQTLYEELVKYADYIIKNEGNLENIKKQTKTILKEIESSC